jgi:flavin reductase (DIM6/NTAB) family NADH-FMN oxidoreductase RutF
MTLVYYSQRRERFMEKNLLKATRMVPCSVVLLSAGTKEKRDAMTATAMFVAEDLPLLTISLAKTSTCRDLIEKTGECVLNVASTAQVDLARKLGATHGRDMDKFAEFQIPMAKAAKIKAPSIAGSFANLECKVITSHQAGNYVVYLVEAVACNVDEKQTPMVWHRDRFFAVEKEVK